jgi:YidC/Oxa1 family membrane protein insertase
MDRNQVIGMTLMGALVIIYFIFFAPDQPIQSPTPQSTEAPAKKEEIQTSAATPAGGTLADSASIARQQKALGAFAAGASGEEKEVVLENKDIKVFFSTRGGTVKKVLLKNYLTFDKKPLYLIDEESSKISFDIPTNSGTISTNLLYFTTQSQNTSVAEKDSGTVAFRLELEPGKYIEKSYKLSGEGFQLYNSFKTQGLENVIQNKDIQFSWINDVKKVERDLEPTRISTTVNYYTAEGDFKNISESSTDPEEERFSGAVKWIAMKQRFFTASIIMDEPFTSGVIKTNVNNPEDTTIIKHLEAEATIPASALKDGVINYRYYFGPNNYQIAKKVTEGFGNNVYLGWTIFSTINKFLVIPIFNFLQEYITNYGIIILILVLVIKLILFPLSYKSHISLAKTKVLKPEIDEIKAKYGDDMQKIQVEQMQLYSKVGVNPLSGCIPVLLQMPIFLALYNFFPNSIELRQESLLWAPDLSTYDSILTLPFYIPGYGDHVSLFCILMTISTLIYTWFNNQVTTVTGPMKSMQYVMPIIFLFIFNSMSAGLTYYYFINNVLTIGQQLGFRAFVNEKKIRMKLEENKVKNVNKKKSKFAQRLEDAMKQAEVAKKVQETKKKKK